MMLHETGPRAQRDRATVIASYRDMVRFFRVPRRDRLTTAQISKMTSKQIYTACRDLYNGVRVKQARKYGIKRGFIAKPKKMPLEERFYNLRKKAKSFFKKAWKKTSEWFIKISPFVGNAFGIGVKHG